MAGGVEVALEKLEQMSWLVVFRADVSQYRSIRKKMLRAAAKCTADGDHDRAQRCWNIVKDMDISVLHLPLRTQASIRLSASA
jgi:hypothetical protein